MLANYYETLSDQAILSEYETTSDAPKSNRPCIIFRPGDNVRMEVLIRLSNSFKQSKAGGYSNQEALNSQTTGYNVRLSNQSHQSKILDQESSKTRQLVRSRD